MKALQITGYGNNELAVLSQNAPLPALKEGDVLVKVYNASVNPVDWKIREGYMKEFLPLNFPVTLGNDFSGVIEETGKNVTAFKKGDAVFGSAIVSAGASGAIAEYLVTSVNNITHKPENISHKIAAVSVAVGTCAYLCLDEVALNKNSKVLIIGGAGGIGRAAIQIAKHTGAFVAATAYAKDMAILKETGADLVINAAEGFQHLLRDYDLVVDTVGGEVNKQAYTILKKGGVLTSVAAQPDEVLSKQYGVTARFILGFANTERLEVLKRLLVDEIFVPHISKTFLLDDAVAALDFQQHGRPGGKVLIKVF